MEVTANDAFDTYREMCVHFQESNYPVVSRRSRRYYEGGVSSVFLWDLDDGGFAGVVLLKKCKSCQPSPPCYAERVTNLD